jgi:hypothetical protein
MFFLYSKNEEKKKRSDMAHKERKNFFKEEKT